MSPTMVIKVVKWRRSLRCLLLCSAFVLHLNLANAKPANAAQSTFAASSMQPLVRPSRPVYTPRSLTSASKKVLTSWNDDGSWQASARLPTSSQSGGNGRSSTTTKTDMTNNGRTIDIDSNQHQQHQQSPQIMKTSGTTSSIGPNNASRNFPPVRSQRRLHKWSNDKTDELNAAAEDDDDDDNDMNDADNDENGPLVQSLSAMASHLMNTKDDENDNLENSSERDVYITEKGHGVTVPVDDQEADSDTEETASEEDSTDHTDVSSNTERKHGHGGEMNDVGGGEEDDDNDDDKVSPKLKSDHYSTTPKGLTTWSAVNGPSQTPMYTSKVTVQKTRPLEYTISSVLSFSTERPTTQEMVVIKERVTTEPTNRITSKVNLMSPNNPSTTSSSSSSSSSSNKLKNRQRPYNKNNKKVLPSKFVKPPLEEVTAEVTSIDDTHVVYKTKVTTEAPEMKSTGVTDYYDRFTTKKPLWPYQMTTRRVPSKRPVPFSRVTPKPKYPYNNKKPQGPSIYMTSPTTTTPASTTTYLRNPQTAIITPLSGLTLSLTDIPFMDFVRSQIIPRIGLTLISFMASTPLLLSLLGAAGLRRRKRSLDTSASFSAFNGKATFEATPRRNAFPSNEQFDFSTIQKKLEDALMKQPTRRRVGVGGVAPPSSSFDLITEAFRQLARWWATTSAPPKSRTVNKGNEGKHKRDI